MIWHFCYFYCYFSQLIVVVSNCTFLWEPNCWGCSLIWRRDQNASKQSVAFDGISHNVYRRYVHLNFSVLFLRIAAHYYVVAHSQYCLIPVLVCSLLLFYVFLIKLLILSVGSQSHHHIITTIGSEHSV